MEPTQTGASSTRQGNGAQAGGGIIGKARDRATEQLTEQKNRAVDGIGSVTQAVRQSTQQLRDQQHDTLAQYVERAANEIDRLAQQLRNKDIGDLFEDAQRLAKRQPALFFGSAFALGFIGTRFLKSSSRRNDEYDEGAYEWRGSTGAAVPYSSRTVTGTVIESRAPLAGETQSSVSPSVSSAPSTRTEASPFSGETATSRARKSTKPGRE